LPSFKVIGIRTTAQKSWPPSKLYSRPYIFCSNVCFYRNWAFCSRRETTYNNQLRILIGLERNCQQMRWLVENEIPPVVMHESVARIEPTISEVKGACSVEREEREKRRNDATKAVFSLHLYYLCITRFGFRLIIVHNITSLSLSTSLLHITLYHESCHFQASVNAWAGVLLLL
jgi:hypothetical protein